MKIFTDARAFHKQKQRSGAKVINGAGLVEVLKIRVSHDKNILEVPTKDLIQ